jgi:MoxR-like ATPase
MTAGSDVSGNGSRAGYADLARLGPARARIAARVVGRERELELILAAVAAGRDMLIEGPPGTSKSMLRAITANGACRWCSSRATPTSPRPS